MKTKFLFLLFFTFTTFFVIAQDTTTVPSQPFLKLDDGRLILGNILQAEEHFFKATIIRLDSFKTKSRNVDFIWITTEYFMGEYLDI
jgi:hypothetical protein